MAKILNCTKYHKINQTEYCHTQQQQKEQQEHQHQQQQHQQQHEHLQQSKPEHQFSQHQQESRHHQAPYHQQKQHYQLVNNRTLEQHIAKHFQQQVATTSKEEIEQTEQLSLYQQTNFREQHSFNNTKQHISHNKQNIPGQHVDQDHWQSSKHYQEQHKQKAQMEKQLQKEQQEQELSNQKQQQCQQHRNRKTDQLKIQHEQEQLQQHILCIQEQFRPEQPITQQQYDEYPTTFSSSAKALTCNIPQLVLPVTLLHVDQNSVEQVQQNGIYAQQQSTQIEQNKLLREQHRQHQSSEAHLQQQQLYTQQKQSTLREQKQLFYEQHQSTEERVQQYPIFTEIKQLIHEQHKQLQYEKDQVQQQHQSRLREEKQLHNEQLQNPEEQVKQQSTLIEPKHQFHEQHHMSEENAPQNELYTQQLQDQEQYKQHQNSEELQLYTQQQQPSLTEQKQLFYEQLQSSGERVQQQLMFTEIKQLIHEQHKQLQNPEKRVQQQQQQQSKQRGGKHVLHEQLHNPDEHVQQKPALREQKQQYHEQHKQHQNPDEQQQNKLYSQQQQSMQIEQKQQLHKQHKQLQNPDEQVQQQSTQRKQKQHLHEQHKQHKNLEKQLQQQQLYTQQQQQQQPSLKEQEHLLQEQLQNLDEQVQKQPRLAEYNPLFYGQHKQHQYPEEHLQLYTQLQQHPNQQLLEHYQNPEDKKQKEPRLTEQKRLFSEQHKQNPEEQQQQLYTQQQQQKLYTQQQPSLKEQKQLLQEQLHNIDEQMQQQSPLREQKQQFLEQNQQHQNSEEQVQQQPRLKEQNQKDQLQQQQLSTQQPNLRQLLYEQHNKHQSRQHHINEEQQQHLHQRSSQQSAKCSRMVVEKFLMENNCNLLNIGSTGTLQGQLKQQQQQDLQHQLDQQQQHHSNSNQLPQQHKEHQANQHHINEEQQQQQLQHLDAAEYSKPKKFSSTESTQILLRLRQQQQQQQHIPHQLDKQQQHSNSDQLVQQHCHFNHSCPVAQNLTNLKSLDHQKHKSVSFLKNKQHDVAKYYDNKETHTATLSCCTEQHSKKQQAIENVAKNSATQSQNVAQRNHWIKELQENNKQLQYDDQHCLANKLQLTATQSCCCKEQCTEKHLNQHSKQHQTIENVASNPATECYNVAQQMCWIHELQDVGEHTHLQNVLEQYCLDNKLLNTANPRCCCKQQHWKQHQTIENVAINSSMERKIVAQQTFLEQEYKDVAEHDNKQLQYCLPNKLQHTSTRSCCCRKQNTEKHTAQRPKQHKLIENVGRNIVTSSQNVAQQNYCTKELHDDAENNNTQLKTVEQYCLPIELQDKAFQICYSKEQHQTTRNSATESDNVAQQNFGIKELQDVAERNYKHLENVEQYTASHICLNEEQHQKKENVDRNSDTKSENVAQKECCPEEIPDVAEYKHFQNVAEQHCLTNKLQYTAIPSLCHNEQHSKKHKIVQNVVRNSGTDVEQHCFTNGPQQYVSEHCQGQHYNEYFENKSKSLLYFTPSYCCGEQQLEQYKTMENVARSSAKEKENVAKQKYCAKVLQNVAEHKHNVEQPCMTNNKPQHVAEQLCLPNNKLQKSVTEHSNTKEQHFNGNYENKATALLCYQQQCVHQNAPEDLQHLSTTMQQTYDKDLQKQHVATCQCCSWQSSSNLPMENPLRQQDVAASKTTSTKLKNYCTNSLNSSTDSSNSSYLNINIKVASKATVATETTTTTRAAANKSFCFSSSTSSSSSLSSPSGSPAAYHNYNNDDATSASLYSKLTSSYISTTYASCCILTYNLVAAYAEAASLQMRKKTQLNKLWLVSGHADMRSICYLILMAFFYWGVMLKACAATNLSASHSASSLPTAAASSSAAAAATMPPLTVSRSLHSSFSAAFPSYDMNSAAAAAGNLSSTAPKQHKLNVDFFSIDFLSNMQRLHTRLSREAANVPEFENNDEEFPSSEEDSYEKLINNKSALGKYIGAPCNNMQCEPHLIHVTCDKETQMCGCEKNYPVKLGLTKGCDKPKKLGEQCFYDETCQYNDENSLCVQVRHNAMCQCASGFHSVSYTKPTRRVFCTQDLDELNSDLPTLLGVCVGIGVLAGLICMVLHLFSKTKYPRHRNFGDANLPPPIMYSSETGIPLTVQSGRPSSRSSIRSASGGSIGSYGNRRSSTGAVGIIGVTNASGSGMNATSSTTGGSKGILVSTSRTGSRRPSLASVHSTSSSVRSYSMMRFEKEQQQKEIRHEMKLRLARLQQHQQHTQLGQYKPQIIIGDTMPASVIVQQHHQQGSIALSRIIMATPSPLTPNSTDELLPSVDELQEYPSRTDPTISSYNNMTTETVASSTINAIKDVAGTSRNASETISAASAAAKSTAMDKNSAAYIGPCSSSTEAL